MTDPADRMETLLDRVHAALTAADYGQLAALTADMEAELARAEAGHDAAGLSEMSGLARVRDRARRNAICLLAAQRGFRAARRRVAEIRAAQSGMVTYDPTGLRCAPTAHGALTQRF